MDIFNRRRVEELEARLRGAEQSRDRYSHDVYELRQALDEVTKLKDSIPEGCTQGSWCKACEFAKVVQYRT